MSGLAEPKHDAPHGVGADEKQLHNVELYESNESKKHTTNAEDAENREHDMTLWQAVKTHPAACFWAFVFCFTIVRLIAPSFAVIEC